MLTAHSPTEARLTPAQSREDKQELMSMSHSMQGHLAAWAILKKEWVTSGLALVTHVTIGTTAIGLKLPMDGWASSDCFQVAKAVNIC